MELIEHLNEIDKGHQICKYKVKVFVYIGAVIVTIQPIIGCTLTKMSTQQR